MIAILKTLVDVGKKYKLPHATFEEMLHATQSARASGWRQSRTITPTRTIEDGAGLSPDAIAKRTNERLATSGLTGDAARDLIARAKRQP